MTWLQFFASIVQSLASLAWPAAVVASVWIFRNDIRPLLPRFRVKHKDTEVSFRLEEAEKIVEQLPAPSTELPLAPPEEVSNFEKIARLSPRAALLEMRREVEDTLRKEVDQRKRPWQKPQSPQSSRQLLRLLRASNAIDPTAANLFEDALAIGNIAAHDESVSFTFEDAMRYRSVVDHAMRFFETPPHNGLDDYGKSTPQERN